jgi:MDMPI C-terminal domain
VTVRGRAADLLLVLAHRAAPDGRVEVDGDRRLFAHWLDHSRF